MKTSLIFVALGVAVGLSQNGVDAFGKKPGYESRIHCSGSPRICRHIWVPYVKPKPRKFCYTDGGRNDGDYKLTTCKTHTKNCKRTNRKMYHEKYHGKREDDSVYLCEYVPQRRLRRRCCRAMTLECIACSESMSKEEFCSVNPKFLGCSPVSFDYGGDFDEDFDDDE